MSEKKTPPRDLDVYADQRAQAIHAENQEIARLNRVLRAEIAGLRDKLSAVNTEAGALQKELSLFARKYDDRPEWLVPPKKPSPSQATIIAALSDVHGGGGEVVRPAEIDGYNKYDLKIAELRLERFFRRSIELARSWSGYDYDGAVLAILGDVVSGTIHDELSQTNEASTYETVLWIVPRLCEGIELWRKAFKHVHVASAPGNHGRDQEKRRYKKPSAHNADTLVARLVAREFARVDGISFEIPESLDAALRVYRFDLSLEHGDELKVFSGTAEIGALGPLMRGTNRKKNALAAQGRNLDYALWGHFHQLIPVPSRGFIANGSLKGYDEYARGRKLKPEPPQQALMVCVPDHGITTQTPVLVADRAAEGW